MNKQFDIFGAAVIPAEPPNKSGRRYKRMQALYGTKPGKTCKTCTHCALCRYRGKNYYKCSLWIISSSAATDIRLKDTACNRWESEDIGN